MKTLPDEKNHGDGKGISGLLTAALLFLCILFVAFFSYRKSLDPKAGLADIVQYFQSLGENTVNEAKVLHVYEYDAREDPLFAVYKDYIVKCGSSGVWFLDRSGNIVRTENILFSNPIMKANGSLLMLADRGMGDICVLDGRTVRWSEKLDASILNADISKEGYVTVVTTAKRDNNEIRVFEPHGIEYLRKIIAVDYAVSACVSPSSKSLVLSAIGTEAAGAFSRYKFYDMEGEDIAMLVFNSEDGSAPELVPLFRYNNDGSIFASGDRAVISVDAEGKLLWKKVFRNVAGTGLVGDRQLAVAAEDEEGSLLRIYDADGRELASCAISGKPRGLNARKGVIAVNTKDTAYFYDSRCRNFSRYSSRSGIKQVLLLNRQHAVIITDREAVVVLLK
ncbi:MAG: DUF5711 family protein [Acetivibrionales bacterium]